MGEFANMVQFLNIMNTNATKSQIKILFDEIDQQGKGNVSLPEADQFISSRKHDFKTKRSKEDIKKKRKEYELYQLCNKIRKSKDKKKKGKKANTLSQAIKKCQYKLSDVLTIENLTKILWEIGVVLITKEKETVLKGVLQGSQKYNKPNVQDFVDFAIKNQIEELNLEESQ